VRKETTSTKVFLVTCLKWLGKYKVAQTPLSDGRGFRNPTPRRLVSNHGNKARVEFVTRSYDWLQGLWRFNELTLGSRKVLNGRLLHWKREKKKRKVKTKDTQAN
jgi:hypothetical protein